VEYGNATNALVSFPTYFAARERLESWIDEYALCLKYCGLAAEDAVCFNHQIKKCNGICCGEEEVQKYNKRANEILTKYTFEHSDMLLIEKGRFPTERSVVLIENGQYAGYGYIDENEQLSSPEELKSTVRRGNAYPDATELVRGWLKQNPKTKKIKLKKEQIF
jgi:DNA polymerase-3 subunit epsilon